MGQVTFDYAAWLLRYPEFSNVTEPQAEGCFDEGCLLISNQDTSPITNLGQRAIILNAVTAHIACLSYGTATSGGASPLVGRIESAAEGSVNVKATYAAAAGSRAWWDQTKYGATVWQLTGPFRQARYLAPPPMPYPFQRAWPPGG